MAKTISSIMIVPVDAAADLTGVAHMAQESGRRTLGETILREIEQSEDGIPVKSRKILAPVQRVDDKYWPIEKDLAL